MEATLIKKKFDYEKAVDKLKQIFIEYDKMDKKIAEECYKIYVECPYGDWQHIFLQVRKSMQTWYNWMNKYNFPHKYPAISEGRQREEEMRRIHALESSSLDPQDEKTEDIGADISRVFPESHPHSRLIFDQEGVDFGRARKIMSAMRNVRCFTKESFSLVPSQKANAVAELKKTSDYLLDLVRQIDVSDYKKR